MVQLLAEDSPSNATVKKMAADVTANVLDFDIVVSDFELQSSFRTNTLEKGVKPFMHPAMD